jgi:hypothetical protein
MIHPPLLVEVSKKLDELARQGKPERELLIVLRRIPDAETLWSLLLYLAPSILVARMVYRRAMELGASEDRARGYLAGVHQFYSDEETAAAITGQRMPQTNDPELLIVWASLDLMPRGHIERLQAVLPHASDPLPVWRAIASTSNLGGMNDIAAEAYRWLIAHEPDEQERERIRALVQERGWL